MKNIDEESTDAISHEAAEETVEDLSMGSVDIKPEPDTEQYTEYDESVYTVQYRYC